MTNFISIFPLSKIVFPGEELDLHITELKYIQLIRDCKEKGKPFGIPVVIREKIHEHGTAIDILKIVKTYPNGEIDIKIRGHEVFRILETVHAVPDKLYKGAIVHYPENIHEGKEPLMKQIISFMKLLHEILNIRLDFNKNENQLQSYDVAHQAGLSFIQKYEFLQLMHELQRQEYLRRHLKSLIPVIAEAQTLKQKSKPDEGFWNLN